VNVAVAVREAQSTVRSSAVDGLFMSNRGFGAVPARLAISELPTEFRISDTAIDLRPSEFQGGATASGPLFQASEPGDGGSASSSRTPFPDSSSTGWGDPIHRTGRPDARETHQDQGQTVALNGTSRYSRLDDSRSVRVVQETGTSVDERPQPASQAVNAEYFRENLPRVRQDVQRCHELQLRETSGPVLERVELVLTVYPDGHADVAMDRDIASAAFGRCLRTRHPSWRFNIFEGDPVTLRLPFALQ